MYCWSHELPRLHTISQMVGTPTALLATPSAPPPHCWPTGHHSNMPCWPTGHHSNIPCWPSHQPHPTVGQLVTTPIYPVGHPISPTTPLSADWSPLQPHCWPTCHCVNIPCQLTGHHSIPTVSHPISPTTPLLANWSPVQPTLLAAPSAHHPTVNQLVITPTCPVGQLVTTTTYPVSHPISSPTPLLANPLLALFLCGLLDRC